MGKFIYYFLLVAFVGSFLLFVYTEAIDIACFAKYPPDTAQGTPCGNGLAAGVGFLATVLSGIVFVIAQVVKLRSESRSVKGPLLTTLTFVLLAILLLLFGPGLYNSLT